MLALATVVAACGSAKSARNAALSTAAPATGAPAAAATPNCHGESAVWALAGPKVYLLPGDRLYGRTKRGTYLCKSQAHALGYKPARHPRRERRRLFSV